MENFKLGKRIKTNENYTHVSQVTIGEIKRALDELKIESPEID